MFTTEQGLAIIVVFALMGCTLWLLRGRRGIAQSFAQRRSREPNRLRLLARLVLGQHQVAHLLQIDGQEYLVVTSTNTAHVVPLNSQRNTFVSDQLRGLEELC